MSDKVPTTIGDAEAASGQPVLFRVVNGVAIVTLSRPRSLNALSHAMIAELARLFELCRSRNDILAVVLRGADGKGFCGGSDVLARRRATIDTDSSCLQFLIDEYRLLYTIHSFRKPVVAILDGIATGGGMGLAQGAQLRVATNRAKLATPGTRFGSFPDVGATWFLASMPAALELYVGLTGALLSGPDALLCNLADICVPSEWLETFEERLECMPLVGPEELLPALRMVFEPPANVVPHSALSEYMPLVIRHFDERMTVMEMVASLEWAWRDEASPSMRRWLQAARDALIGNSPIMLNVAREALLRGRKLTLGDCFRRELEIVSGAMRASDFSEGARAHLIDKHQHPRWKPSSLSEVTRDQIRFFMASPWSQKTHPLGDLERI